MSQCTISLLNTTFSQERPAFPTVAYARAVLAHDGFTTVEHVIETDKVGEAAAEEMFDLTNNPSRQGEREVKYGRLRSVSTGDIVTVDGVDYLCCSMGWEVL